MASWEGLEPPTLRLEGACSIQLSYQDSASIISDIKPAVKTRNQNFSPLFRERIRRQKGAAMTEQSDRPGYMFVGWYVDKEMKKRLNPGGILPRAMTIYDKWVPISYPVTYDLEGGTNHPENPGFITVETGTVQLQPPAKPGKLFGGWYTGSRPIEAIPAGLTRPLTLRATWRDPFKIFFDTGQGGPLLAPVATNSHGLAAVLPSPTRVGCQFLGWYEDTMLKNPFDQKKPIHQDTRLHAKWGIEEYPITYHLNGGINSRRNPTSYTHFDSTLLLQPARKKGFTFVGWQNARGQMLDYIRSRSAGPQELTAIFEPNA